MCRLRESTIAQMVAAMVGQGTSRAFFSVFVIWLGGLGAAAQWAKVSVIFEQLAEVYPKAGLLLGWALTLIGVTGILLGVVAGMLATQLGLRRVFLGGMVLGALVSAVQAIGLNFNVFMASRVVEGVSHLAIVVAAPTLIAQATPTAYRPYALTLWGTFFGVAFAVVAWMGQPLAAAKGPEVLYAAHAVWMAAMAGLAWVVLLPGAAEPDARLTLAGVIRQHLAIYRSPYVSAPAVAWLFYTFCFVSMITLLPPYLPVESRALVIGLIPLATLVSSMSVGNLLLRRVSAIAVIQLSFATTILSLIGLLIWPGAPVAAVIWAGCLGLAQGAGFAAVPELNARITEQSHANGAMAQTGNLGNTIGTPLLLLVLSGAGYAGMIGASILVLAIGLLLQWVLVRARRGQVAHS